MSSVVAKQAIQHIAHFIAAPDTKVPLTQGRAPPPHTHSPRRVLTAHSRPLQFPFFLFFPLRRRHPPHPPTLQEMIGGHLISWYTHHTQNIQTPCFLSRAVWPLHRKQGFITQSVVNPSTFSQPNH